MSGENSINNIEEAARFFQKSKSWIYKNWKILGGKKLGGSLFFPAKEDLYERVFRERSEEKVEIRLHHERNQAHKRLVSKKEGGITSRSKAKGGNQESKTADDNPNRHNLFDISK